MGRYNPRSPYILGEEWVDIRDEDTIFSPAVNSVELGHQFTLATSRTLQDARFYINELPPFVAEGQTYMAAVYPAGLEDQTGPISRVVIPVNNGAVTGASTNGGTVAECMFDPSDQRYVAFSTNVASQQMSLFFATNQYAQILNGKRILAVNLLYQTYASDPADLTILNDSTANRLDWLIANNASQVASFGGVETTSSNTLLRKHFGEINQFWDQSLSPLGTVDRMPWRYVDLQRLEIAAAAAARLFVLLRGPTTALSPGSVVGIMYAALEVIYCEEQRSAIGARAFGSNASFTPNLQLYRPGANIIPMRTIANVVNPTLRPATYTLVVSSASVGDLRGDNGPVELSRYPELNALRELYQVPTMPGIEVDIPFPLEENIGETFTQVETHVLTQLSLHASGGTLTEPHVYGRQGAAQIYGVNTATQDINDDISGVAATYPQVRYYARRFGDTTIPLTLTGVGGLSGSTAAITVADFDALAEIIDGWREVTLRFATPPSMGAVAGNPAWTWSAVGETAGNRWEIMAACAPAISGIPGNLFNLVPSPNQLGTATYEPPLGDTVELTWMPQGITSPFVSGASADQGCDAVLMFSQDPPTVTGVSLTQLTQTVTGIGLDCGSLPCCIPSGIGYQRITWAATSLPSTGFGGYELQRFDTAPGASFQTIMLATSPTITGFNDFEARVGMTSVYRIRALNVLNFAGLWSSYVSGAPPAPGVTGGCSDSTGALIFTSNAAQSGIYNAAYVMQWEGSVLEDFGLPEAGAVQFQPMYGQDGVVAFHGTERGLETFTRTVLLHAAAISPIRLADATTIRDLAWADLPYVCVRDDIGDRWFANVRVPNVFARLNRTKYMARLDIRELTLTPAAVDPA
jgi:hypothetical protein